MTFARILQILLAGLFVGMLPLRAGDNPAPGGDGGVVILPFAAVQLSSNTSANTISKGNDAGNHVSASLSLAGDFDVIRFELPEEMVIAYAVIIIPEHSIVLPARVVAGYLEIDVLRKLRALGDLEINHLEVLVVSANGMVLRFSIKIEEAEEAEEAGEAGEAGEAEEAETTEESETIR